jgi:hypothetical protein
MYAVMLYEILPAISECLPAYVMDEICLQSLNFILSRRLFILLSCMIFLMTGLKQYALVMTITAMVNLLLQGWCPSEVTTVFFDGKLLALKKSSRVRPIAIGYT